MSAEREYLYKIGIPVDEEWMVVGITVDREVVEIPGDPDVYGNTHNSVEVRGTQVTVKLYRTEN